MRIAEKFDLYENALFSTAVTSLTWDDADQRWRVTTDRGDEFRATYVITATGTLTEPKLPGIPGIESFTGHTFHTSRWDYGYTGGTAEGGMTGLAGRKVGIVGTGATGIQAVPMLAEDAEHLYVFQRTPSTVGVRGQRPITAADLGADRPGWAAERRENFLRFVSGEAVAGIDEDLVDDAWTESAALLEKLLPSFRRDHDPDFEAAYEALDHATMERIRARVTEIVEDPETAAALQPWYRYACKRPTFSDRYLPAFNRENVTLVDTADSHGIERMTERGVVVDGVEYEVDALVFATGFSVSVSGITSGRLPVIGRGGVPLLRAWAHEGPRSLHGFASSGFPNLLKMGSLHNASRVNFSHILDEQAVHAAALVAAAESRGAIIEPSREAEDAWAHRLTKGAPRHAWFHAECTPGYYNAEGKGRPDAPTGYPGSAVAFHDELRAWRETSIDEVLSARR
ncbi:NAD(P)/FAD-dependent oxidoreductase [Nocardioides sp. NPDC047086]|uniref:flavin-containing monooxygenase n=1 Tax=Nocardioides sp. NPDC047086 TaxID=3154810 RepID=UPI0033BFD189